MKTYDILSNYYQNYDEDGRLASRHGQVEFLTTMRYIDRYLTPGMRILEIGAGTGRYSHALAQRGYRVDAIELVEHNIEIFKSKTIPDGSYDITLLLGPMYHLFTTEDQKKALSEALRVTKKGGVIFAAYCNTDATIIQFCFQKGMLFKEPYTTLIDPVTFKASSTPEELFVLYRKEDIDALMEGFPVTRLHYVGSDMATNFMRATVDEMDDATFERYLAYHFVICERPDMVGATHHILDIFRKD